MIAAKSVVIPHMDDNGRIKNPKAMIRTENEYLKPFSQAYRSPFLLFGYEKTEGENPRCFEIIFHSKISKDCIT